MQSGHMFYLKDKRKIYKNIENYNKQFIRDLMSLYHIFTLHAVSSSSDIYITFIILIIYQATKKSPNISEKELDQGCSAGRQMGIQSRFHLFTPPSSQDSPRTTKEELFSSKYCNLLIKITTWQNAENSISSQ